MQDSISLDAFNQLGDAEACAILRNCCSAEAWVARMNRSRPYADHASLTARASEHWADLSEDDYLEAFAGHPKIGDVNSLREKYASSKAMAGGEQSGVNEASDAVLHRLADGNTAYEARFGFIFIVFATGKSAAEMLSLLEARLPNSRDEEMHNARVEQGKITALRLDKLIREA